MLEVLADDDFVLVEDRVEVHGDCVDHVEGAEREVDVPCGIVRGLKPAGRVIPSRLGAAGQVGIELRLLGVVQW